MTSAMGSVIARMELVGQLWVVVRSLMGVRIVRLQKRLIRPRVWLLCLLVVRLASIIWSRSTRLLVALVRSPLVSVAMLTLGTV
jgi:hypothetical protein